jgi:Ca2+-binding EF-hand superfamily protein
MKSLGHNTSEADVEEMIKPYDWDGSKTIDFSEFISLMTPKIIELDAQEAHLKVIPGDKELESPVAEPDFHPVPALTPSGTTSTAVTNSTTRRTRVKSTRTKAVERDRDIKEAFKVLDQNGDGFISAAEVKQVLHNFGECF